MAALAKKVFAKREGTNADHGHKFELDLTCFTYLRCLKQHKQNKLKSFLIANNMDHVGAFDDTVCHIQYEENQSLQTRLIFVQTKHKDDPVKHAFSNETLLKGKYLLNDYTKSYLLARQILNESEQCDKFKSKEELEEKKVNESRVARENLRTAFDCKLSDLQFLYYTNAIQGTMSSFENIQNTDVVSDIFDTSPNKAIYKLKSSETPSNIFTKKYKNLDQIEIDRVNQFAEKFKIYIDQKSEKNLETVIKNDITMCLNDRKTDLDIFYKILCDEIKHYFLPDDSPYLTEKINFVEEIYSLLELQFQTKVVTEKYREWSNIFTENSIEKFQKDILEFKILNIVTSKATKTKTFVKCMKVAEKLETELKNVLFLYVKNNESLVMWKKARELSTYKSFAKVVLCFDNINIADIQQVSSSGDNELIVAISIGMIEFQNSPLEDLSSAGIDQLLEYGNIKFQDTPTNFKEMFGDVACREVLETLLSRILNKDSMTFGRPLPAQEKAYRERKYKKNTTILSFEALDIETDLFIVYPKPDESLHLDNKINVRTFDNELAAKEHYFRHSKELQNMHLCLMEKNYLEVISSTGTMENVSKFQLGQNDMDENSFLDHILSHKFTILSDEVGMGKSTCLKHLSNSIHQKHKGYWVEFIELKLKIEKLEDIEEQINSTEALEFIATKLLNLDDADAMVFKHKCSTDGDVALLFDALDEISPQVEKHFLRLVQALSKTNIKTMVVSTRPNFAKELENNLQTFHIHFKGFNAADLATIIFKCSTRGTDDTSNNDKLNVLVGQLADNNESWKSIAAVPLHARMLAELYGDKILDFLSSNDTRITKFEFQSLNLYNLYNDFINMHIDRCMKQKFGMTNMEKTSFNVMKERMFKHESGVWEAIACKEMFPSITFSEIAATDADIFALQIIGILVNKNPFTFMHRSFAEFLSAKCISRLIYQSTDNAKLNLIYKTICIDQTYSAVRKFMNAFFENDKEWRAADVKSIPELEVDDQILMIAGEEQNAYLCKAILHQLSKNEEILKTILNQKTERDQNLLHISAIKCEQIFDDILNSEYFYGTKDCDKANRTPLHWASFNDNLHAVLSYLRKLQGESLSEVINRTDSGGATALLFAAGSTSSNLVETLHEHGALLQTIDEEGFNPLIMAATFGCLETVKFLVERGAKLNINQKNKMGDSALITACKLRNEDIIKYLVEVAEVDVNIQNDDGETALMNLAYEPNQLDIIKLLIEKGADLELVDMDGRTAYMLAATSGAHKEDYVQFFIDSGVDVVNKVDDYGDTCLTIRSRIFNYFPMFRYLIAKNSNVNHQNYLGETALIIAAGRCAFQTIECLLQSGADVNICTNEGDSALITAIKYGYSLHLLPLKNQPHYLNSLSLQAEKTVIEIIKILTLLLQHGANINHRNNTGNTVLHYASSLCVLEVIELLVRNGADVNLKNNGGITPAMNARTNFREGVMPFFKKLA